MLSLLLLSVFASPAAGHESWLEQDVKYIISSREIREFKQLQTGQQRDAFIEEFWQRRDPDPSTVINEFREEHYRRIEYANRRFGNEGRPGWKTARGQTYIIHGPPDDIRFAYGYLQKVSVENPTRILNPAGEALPFIFVEFPTPESETWVYRYLPGAGSSPAYFTVIFAKMDQLSLYTLQRVIGRAPSGGAVALGADAAPSATQQRLLNRDRMIKEFITRQDYFRADYNIVYAGPPRFYDLDEFLDEIFDARVSAGVDLFAVTEAIRDLLRSPGELLEEQRERRRRMEELVRSRVFYGTYPVQVGYGFLRYLNNHVRIPIHAEIELAGKEKPPDELEVFADLVHRESGRTMARLQDSIRPTKGSGGSASISYQTRMSAPPGDYTLRFVVSDLKNQKIGLWEEPIRVPELRQESFGASELILCQDVLSPEEFRRRAGARSRREWITFGGENPLAFDDTVFVPSASRRFRRGQHLTTLVEVYNPTLVQDRPQVRVQAIFESRGTPVWVSEPHLLDYVTGDEENIIIYAFTLPLRRLDPGEYDFLIRVTDSPSGRTLERRAGLKIY